MNGPYFGERFNTSDPVQRTDQEANIPGANTQPYGTQDPVDSSFVEETPMDEALVVDNSTGTPLAEKVPLFEQHVDDMPVMRTAPEFPSMGETIAYKAPINETITHDVPLSPIPGSTAALLNHEESEHFRMRWNEIQGKFVDDPRSAVQQADSLVSEVIGQITQMFAQEHGTLESQWNQGSDVSTEDLRKALQHYRSFFNRLVI